jgi:uncharacterized membrane protein YbhN (UPF0104 family)
MNKTKIHKFFSIVFKTSVLLLSLGYICYKLFYHKDLGNIGASLSQAYQSNTFTAYLLLTLLLMLINWGLETYKWRFLIMKIEKLHFISALKAVLVGVTFSSFTPNRVGDYFGRAAMLENADKRKGFLITIIGSIAQTIVTVIAGTIGFFWLMNIFPLNGYPAKFTSITAIVILIVTNVLLLLFYFKMSGINRLIQKIRFLKNTLTYFEVLAAYSFKELFHVLLLSLFRYFVFAAQFYLLLLIFDVKIPVWDGLALISVIYIVATVIPTIALTELGIKSAAAIYFFELYFRQLSVSGDFAINVVAATFLLWIINLVIPAIAGSFYVYKMKLFKEKPDE